MFYLIIVCSSKATSTTTTKINVDRPFSISSVDKRQIYRSAALLADSKAGRLSHANEFIVCMMLSNTQAFSLMIKTQGKYNYILSLRDSDITLDKYFMSISKKESDGSIRKHSLVNYRRPPTEVDLPDESKADARQRTRQLHQRFPSLNSQRDSQARQDIHPVNYRFTVYTHDAPAYDLTFSASSTEFLGTRSIPV